MCVVFVCVQGSSVSGSLELKGSTVHSNLLVCDCSTTCTGPLYMLYSFFFARNNMKLMKLTRSCCADFETTPMGFCSYIHICVCMKEREYECM